MAVDHPRVAGREAQARAAAATPSRASGTAVHSASATTPAVVPRPSASSAGRSSRPRSRFAPGAASPAKSRYAAITTTLDSSGAAAAARKRPWACSTPALTTATP